MNEEHDAALHEARGDPSVTSSGNLWVVGFDDTGQAALARDEVAKLGWEKHNLILLDVAVAVRYRDGSFTLNGEPFPAVTKTHGGTLAHFLAALALGAPPLTGAAVGSMMDTIGDTRAEVGITETLIRAVEGLIKPGTSALFVLDKARNMDAILDGIRGLGGTVLKTNVDLERAKLIQSTLAASGESPQSNGR
ncbi:MAG TPA: DUF1269 domain-containing protein [Isosphaeraceae bacterium]|jgi:uncharacterized membrane protein|nr:DUF1269 domain-containing protein [Isosphaeraceae bacterium]